jgi:ABC-2 type transport system ATP-binding protein
MMNRGNEREQETSHVAAAGANSQVLRAEDLRKSYGQREALRGLTFSLAPGRVLGFLGPNGAGKTTAIRILTTILEPSSGYFAVDGITSDQPEKIRQKIGVLPESLGFPKRISGSEYLTFFGQLYGRTAADARAMSRSLLEDVRLDESARSPIGSYSRGMRQRLGIARSLVNDPVVVFLDEPTLGLDPRGHKELLALIRRIAQERNAGVVLCSHLLSEIESVCDDVIILMEGKVLTSGTVAEVIAQARRNVVRIRVPAVSAGEARTLLDALPMVNAATPLDETEDWLEVKLVDTDDEASLEESRAKNEILDTLTRAGISVLSFEAEGGRLQDVFFQLTEETVE